MQFLGLGLKVPYRDIVKMIITYILRHLRGGTCGEKAMKLQLENVVHLKF